VPDQTGPPSEATLAVDRARYEAAAHGMQSGVALKMHFAPSETTPKQLRVGVNSAMVEHAALVQLLIAKGVITMPEYVRAMADAMEAERDLYGKTIAEHYGRDVTLG
jgi:hypothetical protein